MKSVANQFTIHARTAMTPQSVSQRKCGIARMRRKKTVRRFRCRSSLTIRRIGC
jgi:hypothetical protein